MAANTIGVPHDSTGAQSSVGRAHSISRCRMAADWRLDMYLPSGPPDRVSCNGKSAILHFHLLRCCPIAVPPKTLRSEHFRGGRAAYASEVSAWRRDESEVEQPMTGDANSGAREAFTLEYRALMSKLVAQDHIPVVRMTKRLSPRAAFWFCGIYREGWRIDLRRARNISNG